MVRREDVLKSLVLTAAVGGIDLSRNGASWGSAVAIVVVFAIALAIATLRSLCFGGRRPGRGRGSERRRARGLGSDFPGEPEEPRRGQRDGTKPW